MTPNLQIEYRPIDALLPYARNPRTHSPAQIAKIAASIVDARDPQAFADATRDNTKLYFFETPANPTMDVVDLAAVCALAKARGALTLDFPRSSANSRAAPASHAK